MSSDCYIADRFLPYIIVQKILNKCLGRIAYITTPFNQMAAGLADTQVICVSQDLPFAQARFCGAEGIESVVAASTFRSTFGHDYGVALTDGKFEGLLARAVVVIDRDGTVLHTELVPEIAQEPDYDAVAAALA